MKQVSEQMLKYNSSFATSFIQVGPESMYVSRALRIIVLRSQGSDQSVILRGLNKG